MLEPFLLKGERSYHINLAIKNPWFLWRIDLGCIFWMMIIIHGFTAEVALQNSRRE